MPRGDSGAGEGCGFGIAEVGWRRDQTVFVQNRVFRQQPVDLPAERTADGGRRHRTVDPILHKGSHDPIADFETGHARRQRSPRRRRLSWGFSGRGYREVWDHLRSQGRGS